MHGNVARSLRQQNQATNDFDQMDVSSDVHVTCKVKCLCGDTQASYFTCSFACAKNDDTILLLGEPETYSKDWWDLGHISYAFFLAEWSGDMTCTYLVSILMRGIFTITLVPTKLVIFRRTFMGNLLNDFLLDESWVLPLRNYNWEPGKNATWSLKFRWKTSTIRFTAPTLLHQITTSFD